MEVYFLLLEPGVPEELLLRHSAVQGVMALAAGGGTLHFQLQFSSVPSAGSKPRVEGRCPVCNVELCLCLLCLNFLCYSDIWPLNNDCQIKGETLATWNFYNLFQPGFLHLASVVLTVILTKPKCKLLAASFKQPNSPVLTDMRHYLLTRCRLGKVKRINW